MFVWSNTKWVIRKYKSMTHVNLVISKSACGWLTSRSTRFHLQFLPNQANAAKNSNWYGCVSLPANAPLSEYLQPDSRLPKECDVGAHKLYLSFSYGVIYSSGRLIHIVELRNQSTRCNILSAYREHMWINVLLELLIPAGLDWYLLYPIDNLVSGLSILAIDIEIRASWDGKPLFRHGGGN